MIDKDQEAVVVSTGLKSDSVIALNEFKDAQGSVQVEVGDEVEVMIEMLETVMVKQFFQRKLGKSCVLV